MCRASEAFKTEFLKNAYKNIWTKNSNFIVKNKHNAGLKIKFFEFLAIVGQFRLKKKMQTFFFKFFYLKSKNSLGFLIGKHPLLQFFSKQWLSYVHLYLLASEALHIGRIGNMTKPLWILYQLGKLFLIFG